MNSKELVRNMIALNVTIWIAQRYVSVFQYAMV